MTIYDQIKETLKVNEIKVLSSTEVKEELKAKYGTNPSSIILSDYCYNRTNDGILFDKHLFEYQGRNKYVYLGENNPYTGKIYHRPIGHKTDIVVGEWLNGKKMYPLKSEV